jgi:hypothetical protein
MDTDVLIGAAACCGLVCGVAVALPVAWVLRRSAEPSLARGLGAVLLPFVIIQLAMIVLWRHVPAAVSPFGVTATMSYLGMVVIMALR